MGTRSSRGSPGAEVALPPASSFARDSEGYRRDDEEAPARMRAVHAEARTRARRCRRGAWSQRYADRDHSGIPRTPAQHAGRKGRPRTASRCPRATRGWTTVMRAATSVIASTMMWSSMSTRETTFPFCCEEWIVQTAVVRCSDDFKVVPAAADQARATGHGILSVLLLDSSDLLPVICL